MRTYECTVLFDASAGYTVQAETPEAAAEIAEYLAAEAGAGSLCHQCSDRTSCGGSYGVMVYENDNLVLETDFAAQELGRLRQEVAVLSEYRNACIAFSSSFGVETDTLDEAVEIERAAEERLEAASQACWRFYDTKARAITE